MTAKARAPKSPARSGAADGARQSMLSADDDQRARFLACVAEQHPFALAAAEAAWQACSAAGSAPAGPDFAGALRERLMAGLGALDGASGRAAEATPFVTAAARLHAERERLAATVDAFFAREAIAASFSADDKRWLLQGIILTRAVDNRMKQLFLSSEMKYGELGFQGKGFRSLGQEAIYGAALRLRRGGAWSTSSGWCGDVVAPIIRDLGVMLAFTDNPELALNAQVGKDGAPSDGKDLHIGAADQGVIMAAAPLTIATCTATGYALAFARRREQRVAVSFIGEGGSSLGEWHEAINMAAAMKLPAVFCVQNNQTALSTPVREQSRVRTFGEKAVGYGIPHVTVDGTDPEAIAAAFAWAAERARAGHGPALIETVAMRLCGHAHHDDMLYLGADPPLGFDVPPTPERGYVDQAKYRQWAERDPLACYARRLTHQGVVDNATVARWQDEATARVEEAVARLRARSWPPREKAGRGVFADGREATHPTATAIVPLPSAGTEVPLDVAVEPAPAFHPKGQTFLDAIARGIEDVLASTPESFVIGEDVGPPYGNAFLLLKPLVERFPDRLVNTPIAEGAIVGACVGAALAGMRPIGEIQFNDFVASGFNQVVNNAAKLRYRSGSAVPMVLRMPWGGLRRAGPYHSQDTSPWFFRSFGLKIVVPSTPHDARALLVSAVRDPDPVLFYEHIGLYRDPRIKQPLDDAPASLPLGRAAFRRVGSDLSLIAYGAYVHRAMAAAERLAREDGVECDVLDLRSLVPLDWARIEATVRRTGKVLLVGEDSRTGSVLESIASRLHESLFMELDGPVRVLGSLDTPVPYAPSLEDAFLLSEHQILATARALAAF